MEIYCGWSNATMGEMAAIGIGSLDEPHRIRPTFHQWVSSKLPWFEISDDLPRFADNELTHPSERLAPIVEDGTVKPPRTAPC